ncbi:MAG: hypothetical protein IPK57_10000 [Chitinophagaceae bacterium]|nr:hypothetical protein [Chitinophagaceae bacterium]
MKLDYDSMKLTFFTKGTFRYPKGGYLLKPSISQLVTQPLRVRDAETVYSRFLYDMGAGLCLLLSRKFVDDSALIHKKGSAGKRRRRTGRKIDMELTVIKEVRVGPL